MDASPPTSRSTFRFPVRVYWEDTDAGGVVFYANYLKFFERARTEWLRSLGVGQQALREATGAIFIVAETQLRYIAPARLDDALLVLTKLAKVRAASVDIHQRVMRQHAILTEADVEAAFVTPEGRPRRQPRYG